MKFAASLIGETLRRGGNWYHKMVKHCHNNILWSFHLFITHHLLKKNLTEWATSAFSFFHQIRFDLFLNLVILHRSYTEKVWLFDIFKMWKKQKPRRFWGKFLKGSRFSELFQRFLILGFRWTFSVYSRC